MKKSINCKINFDKPEKTFEIGIIILGKYTFPNILALFVKVVDVVLRQSAK